MAKNFNLEDTVIKLKINRKELVHLTKVLESSLNGVDDDSYVKHFIKHFNEILEESKNQFEVLTDVEKENENTYTDYTEKPLEDAVIERMKREYPMSIFRQIQEDQHTLFAYKQDDYGPGNIAMNGNFMLSLLALGVRMNDKTQRILHILNNKMLTDGDIHDVNNESLEDSFQDLSVYGVIAQIVLAHKWGK